MATPKTEKVSKVSTLKTGNISSAKLDKIGAEFSPLLAARLRAAKLARVMEGSGSFRFRLGAALACDARLGQHWG